MFAEAPLVWLASEAPAAHAQRALDTWASARGVRLVSPRASSSNEIAIDFTIADRVEEELERAREAIAAQDADAADAALMRAEKELLAHPELPQAAWLLAEVERGRAARFSRIAPIDAERAERSWARAAALDGGRVSGIGEPRASTRAPTVRVTITAPAGMTLTIDGVAASAGAETRDAGAHQVVAAERGRTAWAAWVLFAEGTTIAVPDVSGPPCAADDLSRVRATVDGIDARGVRCARWVAALPGEGESQIRVASCERDRCGPLLEWRALRDVPLLPPPVGEGPYAWPAWRTWALAGAGAVAVGVVVLVASGALAPTHTDVRFVNGGIKPAGARFSF
jgi:hypothetical protein